MPFISLSALTGYLTVGTTPVRLTANQAVPGTRVASHTIFVQQHEDNTENLYLCHSDSDIPVASLNPTTGVGVVATLLSPTTITGLAFIAYTVPYAPGGLNAGDYYLMSDGASQKCTVSVIQA
jgi:hypothetical protein